jgi:predicted signal transduction protein with EAL and GGDEF domain
MIFQGFLHRLLDLGRNRPSDELVVAQLGALKKRIPILDGVLSINTLVMLATHRNAPAFLSFYAPLVIVGVMLVRLVYWHGLRNVPIGPKQARSMLRQMTVYTTVIAVITLAWAMALYPYAEAPHPHQNGHMTEPGHTVLFVGLTVICCFSLLMHAPTAAILTVLIVIPPFAGFLMWQGSLVERAVAINLALVAASMI